MAELSTKLRGLVAEYGIPQYILAAQIRVHPCTLSKMLRGHVPIPRDVAERIRRAVSAAK